MTEEEYTKETKTAKCEKWHARDSAARREFSEVIDDFERRMNEAFSYRLYFPPLL